jgi:hypothetical protein
MGKRNRGANCKENRMLRGGSQVRGNFTIRAEQATLPKPACRTGNVLGLFIQYWKENITTASFLKLQDGD